jgi:hypothetical protein
VTYTIVLDQEHRANLLTLAEYLESLPVDYDHFSMFAFADHKGQCELPDQADVLAADKPEVFLSNCGTVACAVGHGPAAGLEPIDSEFVHWKGAVDDFDWDSYCDRVFGASGSALFEFLFSGKWTPIDNHHYGAAARIRYFLETGLIPMVSYTAPEVYAPYRKKEVHRVP